MIFICVHSSPAKFAWYFFCGSAAGTGVMPKLASSPVTASAMRITPDQPGSAAKVLQSQPPATVPPMMARKVPSSITPLPHESFFSGSSSGSRPYFDGPKMALWTPIRNTPLMVT